MSKKRYPATKVLAYLTDNISQKTILEDSLQLVELMENWTGYPSLLWDNTTVGYGSIPLNSFGQKSLRPMVSFTPRKKDILLDVFSGLKEHEYLLENLGDFTKSKSIIYIKTLASVNLISLETIVYKTIEFHKSN